METPDTKNSEQASLPITQKDIMALMGTLYTENQVLRGYLNTAQSALMEANKKISEMKKPA